jgi:hypothetical protein
MKTVNAHHQVSQRGSERAAVAEWGVPLDANNFFFPPARAHTLLILRERSERE